MRVEEYDLHLDVDYPEGTFRGELTISFTATGERAELDSVGLTIGRVEVDGAPQPVQLPPGREKLVVEFPAPGDHRVHVEYSGRAGRDVLTGFYLSRFGERPLVTTMMEPIGCRRFMPCLDEPRFKAVFRLSVAAPGELTVISNAAAVAQSIEGARRRWIFGPTPRMSTYLLYVGVGPFEERELRVGRTRIIAATAPGRSASTQWALDTSAQVLPAFEAYYGLPYPIDKLHLIGIPDIASGAMENWGAIAFSELAVLVDGATTPSIRRWATESIVHEIAHQWFGNLVTMETFDDLWLNEAFATFVAAKMQDRLGLRHDAWGEFAIRTQSGWIGDSLRASHPVKFELHDPAEISEKFDEITYFKGSYLLRMLEAFVGEKPFRRGVQNYLQQHLYSNARGEALWRSLAEVTGLPIERVARDWVERPGHPLVRVYATEGGVRLEQERFLYDRRGATDAPRPIPLRIISDGKAAPLLFDSPSTVVRGVDAAHASFNPGRAGFFRVWYEPALRAGALARAVRSNDLELWAFANDTAAFLLAGDVTVEDYLTMVQAATTATDFATVCEVCESIEMFDPIFSGSAGFRSAAMEFYRAQSARLGLQPRPGEHDSDSVLRQAVSNGRVLLDPDFARDLAARFAGIDSAEPALRPAIALAAARSGTSEALEELVRRLGSENENAAVVASLALGHLPTPELVAKGLSAWKNPGVRTSSVSDLVRSAAENPIGAEAAWDWMASNLEEYDRRARESAYLPLMLKMAIPYVGLVHPREVREYFAGHSFADATTAISQGLEFLGVFERLRDSVRAAPPPLAPVPS